MTATRTRGTVVVDLAITPGGRPGDASPLGKPGSKRKLSDYEREVAHALMRKGHPRRDAIRMARGIIDKAAATGRWGRGKVRNPAVRAGSVASIAQRKAFSHGHSNTGGEVIDLARLSKDQRDKLPDSAFVFPSQRAFPIHDEAHARAAIRLAGRKGPKVQAKVRAAVKRRYPHLDLSESRPFDRTDLSWRDALHPRGWHGRFTNSAHPEASSDRNVKVSKITLPVGQMPARKPTLHASAEVWSTSDKPKSRRRGRTKTGRSRRKTRVDRAMVEQKRRNKRYRDELERQREQARRIIARNGMHLGAAHPPRTGKLYRKPDVDRSRIFTQGFALSSFSEVPAATLREINLSYAALLDQNITIDLSEIFEKLHPRDWRGRFIKKGGLRGPLDEDGRVIPTRSEEFAYRKHVKRADAALIENMSRLSTDNDGVNGKTIKHADGSTSVEWSKERAKLHREIVDTVYRRQAKTAKSEKKALFLGGLPGAGKSTSIKRIPGLNEDDYITINPDIFKEELAHRGLVPELEGLSPLERSGFVHEESSTMALMLAEKARRNNKNIIWDITMNKASSVHSRLNPLRESGYSANAVFVDIPFEMSQGRVEQRHRSGHLAYWRDTTGTHIGQRLVPSSHVATGKSKKGSTSANRDAFEDVKQHFDAYKLYDNSGEKPRLLEEQGRFRP
jgi:hypothetical protein